MSVNRWRRNFSKSCAMAPREVASHSHCHSMKLKGKLQTRSRKTTETSVVVFPLGFSGDFLIYDLMVSERFCSDFCSGYLFPLFSNGSAVLCILLRMWRSCRDVALRSVTRNFNGITTVRPFPPPKHTYHTIHVCDMHARKKRELRICLQEFIVCGCSHLLVFIRLTRRGREWVNFRSNRIASQCDATPSQSSNLLIIKRQTLDERSKIFKDALHRSFLHSKTSRQNPERRNPFFRPTISSLTSNLGQKLCSNEDW